MRRIMWKGTVIIGLVLLAATGQTFAQAEPPGLVNYQGVLRDGAGDPEAGDFEIIFRFFDASGGGSEILFDEHCAVAGPAVCAAETGAVTVTGGLFNVQLGGGNVADGAGVGVYGSLGEVFRDFNAVWMQIEIFEPVGAVFQVLSPRVRVISAAYALNADHLDGRNSLYFLDTSGMPQTKSGALTLQGSFTMDDVLGAPTTVLTETGMDRSDPGAVTFNVQNSGAGIMTLLVDGNTAWHGGNDGPGSGLDADLLDGNSSGDFINTGAGPQTKLGNLTVADLTVSGNNINFGALGATIVASASEINMIAGDADTDDLRLEAGNGAGVPSDGAIVINGAGNLVLVAGGATGDFVFENGALSPISTLSETGDLQIDGELTASGTGTSTIGGTLDVNGTSVLLTDGTTISVGGAPATLTIDGLTMDINLGASAPDDVFVPGDLFVTGTKSFLQNHPYRKDSSIAYVALEGDEAGTYTRGSARLSGGEARVPLGETFGWVTNPDIGLTAHVTPRGGWADLYVESVTTRDLVVRSRDGADADFDYVVYGLRVGYEDVPVVQARKREATVPSEGYWSALYDRQPDLRAYSPLARYRRMRGEARGVAAAEDWSASRALRAGIGEHQPGPDTPPKATDLAVAGGTGAAVTEPAVSRAAESGAAAPGAAGVAIAGGSAGAIPMDSQGNVYARSFRPSAADLASLVQVAEPVTAGDVLVIDSSRPGLMSLARVPEDTAVFGVVAGEPGVVLGASPPQGLDTAAVGGAPETGTPAPTEQAGGAASVPVALSGIVLCKVDASYGAVRAGDLLTTSGTPGHARRADNPRPGTILGKALEPLESATGLIRVLVTLR